MKDIRKSIVSTSKIEWLPLIEEGIPYAGIYVKSLRKKKGQNRSDRILLKFEANASYPYHNHPAGEEIFVLEGSCEIENTILNKGDYLYTAPRYKHSVKSEEGCVLLLFIPEEVEKL
jgi:quercetin dioxygenase-like cupin family protein